jgi:hypothetical protein
VKHRQGCTFGPGFYRIELISGSRRYCQDEEQVRAAYSLLIADTVKRVARDGYCLDPLEAEASPHVIDGETFLHMPQKQAQEALGGVSEAEYARAYRAVEDAVLARDRAIASGAADRPSIVIKKKGKVVLDAMAAQ